jgi:hypothetical protein
MEGWAMTVEQAVQEALNSEARPSFLTKDSS